MQRGPLAVVDVVDVEDVVAVILQKSDQRALLHLILYKKVAQLVQGLKDSLALRGFALG